MNGDRLIEEYTALVEWADENLHPRAAKRRTYGDRGGVLRKTPYADALSKGADAVDDDGSDDGGDEPTSHAKTKAAHHDKMAELHAKISALHGKMSDHYAGGAQGAHHDQGGDEEHDGEADAPRKDDAE